MNLNSVSKLKYRKSQLTRLKRSENTYSSWAVGLMNRIKLLFIPFYYKRRKPMMIDQTFGQLMSQWNEKTAVIHTLICQLHFDGITYQPVEAMLLEDSIVFKIIKVLQVDYLKILLNFDLVFEIMKDGQSKANEIIGLKFEKYDKQIILKTNETNSLRQWKNFLQLKINQRGFHELFKPIKKIGKGNFASVYLVIKHEDGKRYAVKAFSKEGTFGEEKGKQSLINEIDIMRKLKHKNLMKIQGVFESQNSIYVSVELLEGGQLYDKIKNKHKFGSAQIKTIMKGILEGLEVMHEQKIMHRDLKPENILLRKDGDYDCVIADFGLSEYSFKQEYIFARCGTPGYVAPQVVNLKDIKAKYDPICDLFSVGVIFHLLALRKSPFPGRQYDEVLAQNKACKIDFEASQYHQMPQIWLDLLKRLLEKDPKKRITATQALNHDFFTKDQMFAEFTNRRSAQMTSDRFAECESPLMMTRNHARKNPNNLRNDSCLKFKMKENLMSGRTDQGEGESEIDSPMLLKAIGGKNGQSRFKRLAKND